jgi:hypothetical protein
MAPEDATITNSVRDWIESIVKMLSLVAIPIVIAIYSAKIQESIQRENINRDYVQLAVSVLKEESNANNAGLKAWAVKILAKYSVIPLEGPVQEQLKTGAVTLPSNAPQAPVRMSRQDAAIQLSRDILEFVARNQDKQPKYNAHPTLPGGVTSEVEWKVASRKFDEKISGEFHTKFDKKIENTVPRLEMSVRTVSALHVMDDCHKVQNLVSASTCAGDILAMAVSRPVD